MKLRKYFSLAALMTAMAVSAQSHQFPMTSDPTAFALGNTGIVSDASAFSVYNNSAATAFSMNKGAFGLSYLGWGPKGIDSKIPSFAGYYKLNHRLTMLLGAQYAFYKKYDLGSLDKSFRPHDVSLTLGASYRFADCLSGAVNMRYLNSKIYDKSASAFGMDLQMMYRKERFGAALALENIGSKYDYGYGVKVKQPMQINAGLSYELFNDESLHGLEAYGRVGYVFMPKSSKSVIAAAGLEYSFIRVLFVRAGYSYSKKDKYVPPFATVGLGVHLANIHLNGGYLIATTKHSPIKNSFIIGVSYNLF